MRPELVDLQEKIKILKKSFPEKESKDNVQNYNIAINMITDLLGCIFVGLAIGLFFQKVFHTSVLLTAGFTLLGGVAGLYTVLRFALAEEKKQHD